MSRYYSYLNSAKEILQQYKGEEPFASFIKKFFSANKKYGSKDRKQISQLCYSFFRLGKAVMNVSLDEKILVALFLCTGQPNKILEALRPEWNSNVGLGIEEKYSMLNALPIAIGTMSNVFPWEKELSEEMDFEKYCSSFFIQPDLFLRLRPGKEELVKGKLSNAGIEFETVSANCLVLPNATKIDTVLEIDKDAVIQDLNSQQVGRFLGYALAPPRNDKPAVWDCCAGSGGKSIMAYDLNPKIILTVSDMRESILANLKKRFQVAGIKSYTNQVVDLVAENYKSGKQLYDIIIADVPCTGSGTWSRTPEQLYFFNENKISNYARVQKQIVSNVIPQFKPGGSFIYITCSVFKKENEEVVEFIEQKLKLRLVKKEIIQGYEKKADTMFVAVFNSLSS